MKSLHKNIKFTYTELIATTEQGINFFDDEFSLLTNYQKLEYTINLHLS